MPMNGCGLGVVKRRYTSHMTQHPTMICGSCRRLESLSTACMPRPE